MITYLFGKFGFQNVNYLDDLGAAEEDARADEAYDCLGRIMDSIGIKESKGKTKPLAYIAIFLGILFNTISMTLTITAECLEEIRNILREWIIMFRTAQGASKLVRKVKFRRVHD